jgi:hypothetical protein
MKEMDNANQQFLKAIQTMQTMKLLIKSKQQEIDLMRVPNQFQITSNSLPTNSMVGMKRRFDEVKYKPNILPGNLIKFA